MVLTGSREAYQAAMSEAHALAWTLKWEAAGQRYRQALAELPDDATARLSLAVALSKTGQSLDALQEYLAVRELLPRDTLIVGRIAELHLRLGDPESAIRAYLALAQLYLSFGERPKAIGAWRHALENATGHWRPLQELKAAVEEAGATELLPDIQVCLSQTPPDRPVQAIPLASEATVEGQEVPGLAATGARELDVPGLVVEYVTATAGEDPLKWLSAAEAHARAGRVGMAAAEYLRASAILPEGAAAAARRAAAGLTGDWIVGDLDEVLVLPPALWLTALDALEASAGYLRRKELDAALDEGLRAVACGASYLPAQIRLAEIYHQRGRTDEARARLVAVAELYTAAGQSLRAVSALRQQVAQEPDRPELRQLLVDCLLAAGETSRAAESLDDWAVRQELAGESRPALAHYREAIRLVPRADRWLRHGSRLEAMEQIDEALNAYIQARLLAPAEEIIAAGECRCQALLGRWAEMAANLEEIVRAMPDDPILAGQVITQAKAAVERAPTNLALRYCFGRWLEADGNAEAASDELTLATQANSLPGKLAIFHLASTELATGRTTQAIERLWTLADLPPLAAEENRRLADEAILLLVEACPRSADWRGTAKALARLLEIRPDDEAIYAQLAEAYFKIGEVALALVTFGQLASLYERHGDDERAIGVYRGMVQLSPANATTRETLGRLYLKREKRVDGLVELEEAAAIRLAAGEEDEAVGLLREMLEHTRMVDAPRALAIRERLSLIRPADVEIRSELVEAYLKSGRSVKALAEARALTDYLVGEGRLEDAAGSLRTVIRLDPWNISEQVRLGTILGLLGRTDEATATLKKVIERDPDNQPASRALAHLLSDIVAREGGLPGGTTG